MSEAVDASAAPAERAESVDPVDDDTVLRKRYECYLPTFGGVKLNPREVLDNF